MEPDPTFTIIGLRQNESHTVIESLQGRIILCIESHFLLPQKKLFVILGLASSYGQQSRYFIR